MESNPNSGDWPWNPKINAPEYIICAAVWFNGDVLVYDHQPKNIEYGMVICGRRHHNCFYPAAIKIYGEDLPNSIEGFLTSKDRFLTRSEALELAIKTGQTNRIEGELYSEDLY